MYQHTNDRVIQRSSIIIPFKRGIERERERERDHIIVLPNRYDPQNNWSINYLLLHVKH